MAFERQLEIPSENGAVAREISRKDAKILVLESTAQGMIEKASGTRDMDATKEVPVRDALIFLCRPAVIAKGANTDLNKSTSVINDGCHLKGTYKDSPIPAQRRQRGVTTPQHSRGANRLAEPKSCRAAVGWGEAWEVDDGVHVA